MSAERFAFELTTSGRPCVSEPCPGGRVVRLLMNASVDDHRQAAAALNSVAGEHGVLEEQLNAALLERDNARADARLLAHAYRHDSRPPEAVVERALGYPVQGGETGGQE